MTDTHGLTTRGSAGRDVRSQTSHGRPCFSPVTYRRSTCALVHLPVPFPRMYRYEEVHVHKRSRALQLVCYRHEAREKRQLHVPQGCRGCKESFRDWPADALMVTDSRQSQTIGIENRVRSTCTCTTNSYEQLRGFGWRGSERRYMM